MQATHTLISNPNLDRAQDINLIRCKSHATFNSFVLHKLEVAAPSRGY